MFHDISTTIQYVLLYLSRLNQKGITGAFGDAIPWMEQLVGYVLPDVSSKVTAKLGYTLLNRGLDDWTTTLF